DNKEVWWRPAILMFARVSAWIVAPVLLGAFLGKWLDNKYNTEPWLFLWCVGFAFVVSMIGLIKNTKEEYKKIEDDIKNKNKNKDA
ncbi:MAG: AtpZ/AtpI family protein, partial [Candidatus Falkowbacteria bacterium]